MSKKTRGDISIEVSEIAGAASRAHSPVPRALDDMEELVHPGAREIATLTVIARSQDWQFKPLMEALQIASKITDWSHPWMVAENIKGDKFGPRFNWRDAPYRKYKSFEDFYSQELEETWGKWEELQRTWSKIVKGEISEEEGRRIVLRGRGRPPKDEKGGQQESDSTLKSNEKNTKAHWLARLDRDRPDLAARVRAKAMSANAAAIEAGFRKKRIRPKQTRVQKINKLLDDATRSERREIWNRLKKEFE